MSEAKRTIEEYIKLYSIKHGKTAAEVLDHAMVKSFKSYKEHEYDEFNLETENSTQSKDWFKDL